MHSARLFPVLVEPPSMREFELPHLTQPGKAVRPIQNVCECPHDRTPSLDEAGRVRLFLFQPIFVRGEKWLRPPGVLFHWNQGDETQAVCHSTRVKRWVITLSTSGTTPEEAGPSRCLSLEAAYG